MRYIFILLSVFVFINSKEEPNQVLNINFYPANKEYLIGKEKGIIAIESNDFFEGVFNRSDIEEKTQFNLELTDTDKTYTLFCRLWLGNENKIASFCNFNDSLKQNITIASKTIRATTTYNTYELNIVIEITNIKLTQIDYNIPFLYSAPTEINVDEQEKTYNLEFKIDSYNNELLFMRAKEYRIVPLENCQKNSNILKCEFSKDNLDIIANTENTMEVIFVNDYNGWFTFNFTCPITIKYPQITKENIYFALDKLQDNIVDRSAFVTFSTNVTDISNIKTNSFELYFSQDTKTECYFIKHDKSTPLYITCYASKTITDFPVGEIDGFTKDNIHYKYNFILGPGSNEEKISILEPKGTFLIHSYPDTLDFTKSDSYDIYFAIERVDRMRGITLNPEKGNLECVDLNNIKKCKVPKSHFDGKKGGLYFINHFNNVNKYSANYETFGIKVILPGDSTGSGRISKFSLGLFALLCFLAL